MNPNAIIVIRKMDTYIPSGKYLLARSDGSCKWRDKTPHCGAGIVIHTASNDQILIEILTIFIPLPAAHDSLEAEAIGAAKACNGLLNLLQRDKYQLYTPIIRGDNKPVIGFNGTTTRLRSLAMFHILEPGARAAYKANVAIRWQHFPIAHNPVADKLGNEGSDAALDGTYASRCDIDGSIMRPGIGDYRHLFG